MSTKQNAKQDAKQDDPYAVVAPSAKVKEDRSDRHAGGNGTTTAPISLWVDAVVAHYADAIKKGEAFEAVVPDAVIKDVNAKKVTASTDFKKRLGNGVRSRLRAKEVNYDQSAFTKEAGSKPLTSGDYVKFTPKG